MKEDILLASIDDSEFKFELDDSIKFEDNFDSDSFKDLLLEITAETDRLEKESFTRSYSLFRRNNIFEDVDNYLHNTVAWSNNPNKLLFNGELDFITGNIYEILTTAVLWRYFNTLNEAYLNIAKLKCNNKNLNLFKNYGIIFCIDKLTNFHKNKIFQSISNPLVLFKTVKYLNHFRKQFHIGTVLYTRFELYGFIDYLNSISSPVDYANLIEDEMTSKFQHSLIKLPDKYPFLDRLDSIYAYSRLLLETSNSEYLDNSVNNVFSIDKSDLLNIILKKYQNVISLCFNLRFPISISHSYTPIIKKKKT